MINIVIPVSDKDKEKFQSLLSRINGEDEIKVFVAVENKNHNFANFFEDSDNIFFAKFQDGTKKEEMINALQKYIKGGSILVLRKPISLEELNKFITCKHDLATCRVVRSKIKAYFFNLWQSILKLFLGVKEYDGDTSAVYLSEDISAVIGESGNLSYSSRVNRWRGVEQTTIEVKGQPAEKEIDRKSIIKGSILASVLMLVAVAVTVALSLTVKISVIIGLLIVCLDLICLAITILTIITTIFNSRVGQKKINQVIETL